MISAVRWRAFVIRARPATSNCVHVTSVPPRWFSAEVWIVPRSYSEVADLVRLRPYLVAGLMVPTRPYRENRSALGGVLVLLVAPAGPAPPMYPPPENVEA